jgi:hypothetical protein
MKWFRAISYSIFVSLQVFLSPLLFKWYTTEMGLSMDSLVGVAMFFGTVVLIEIAIMIFFYASAIQDKELKDLKMF